MWNPAGVIREGEHHEKANEVVGVMTWLFFGTSIITVFIFLLGSINNDFEFRKTAIFLLIFISCFFLTVVYLILSSKLDHIRDEENDLLFFMNDVDLVKLIWIPTAFFLVSITSIGLAFWPSEYADDLSIIISGIILFVAFERTGAIMVPILAHGFYNSLVVALDNGLFGDFIGQSLSTTGIKVPEIGLAVGDFNKVATEMIFQVLLVAAAEEMFKIFIIIFTIVAIRVKFDTDLPALVILGGIVSVIVWWIYHTILVI